ncbi:endonuclease/exonuclease/phosphatase family protein [Fulvivirgaceae bacterium PWU5]|uniref:Endonuclease/exonuclease/phosphatase family protein n=1 Tax=Dawidia cretensis TaxID=2782350 RepID=A0AAP2GV94_9BACT|nr:endonuclease/exonuclease/phosphatase family protein [Dawidia cretensis]MBT1708642.1 endonuclease/exonuclease/phosphatase family protein [Dawidia cretensis]
MPFYTGLRKFLDENPTDLLILQHGDAAKRKAKLQFIIDRMLRLKRALREQIPAKTVSDSLLLATWNLREFDSNGKKQGPRLIESFYYIAEIINSFDLVAVQEVKQDLSALKTVMRILGPGWDFLVTDITEGTSGNGERMAYIYNKSKVLFTNIAGEIVLPSKKDSKVEQFARTPYLVSFQSGWLKLNLCTVHIYFGSGQTLVRRVEEIGRISEFFKKRSLKDQENYILLGDFNIVGKEDETMKALLKGGFKIPDKIQKNTKGSNLDKSKFYDQIVYRDKKGIFNLRAMPVSSIFMNTYLKKMKWRSIRRIIIF